MSIGTEITRLANAKSAIATAITNKGVTVPSSTKLDGMAALINSIANQAELESITVKTPPTKLDYISGDTFDATGLVLTVLVGEVEIDITSGYTITPETMAADTTAVTISYTAGGKTVSTTQAVTVLAADPVLANNTIAHIAALSASGSAGSMWSVGDQITVPINGVNYTAKIMGFNLHDLDTTDAKYNDASYNNGLKKAGITFMFTTLFPYEKMNTTNTNAGGWKDTYMRNTVMPSIKNSLPSGYSDAIRIVSIPSTAGKGVSDLSHSADSLFLPSYRELKGANWGNNPVEGDQFPYFEAGNEANFQTADGINKSWWTRSCYIGAAEGTFLGYDESKSMYTNKYATVALPQLICFCV